LRVLGDWLFPKLALFVIVHGAGLGSAPFRGLGLSRRRARAGRFISLAAQGVEFRVPEDFNLLVRQGPLDAIGIVAQAIVVVVRLFPELLVGLFFVGLLPVVASVLRSIVTGMEKLG